LGLNASYQACGLDDTGYELDASAPGASGWMLGLGWLWAGSFGLRATRLGASGLELPGWMIQVKR